MSAAEALARLVREEDLPPSFADQAERYLKPAAIRIAEAARGGGRTLSVGLSGPQGSGKSTIAKALVLLLDRTQGLRTAVLSLDDLYLTRSEREALGREVHPLYRTRGPPGTHDVALGIDLFERLAHAAPDEVTPLPSFDKAIDDRRPAPAWPSFRGRPDVILFEGWCVGAQPEPDPARLAEPMNELERNEDPAALWRRAVDAALAGPYRALFNRLDLLIYLQAPAFEHVYRWRALQERKLAARLASTGERASALLDEAALGRFIAHYERITRRQMTETPARADIVLTLDEDHALSGVILRG